MMAQFGILPFAEHIVVFVFCFPLLVIREINPKWKHFVPMEV